ncbi:hypothetical protein ACVND7_11290 [Avibacterium paragallinarum]|uniref:Uncharacterized protein n=1 Tax=Avibacterium paragallinarum TaxID=728 RepID=A0ABU7QJ78_AVIPA
MTVRGYEPLVADYVRNRLGEQITVDHVATKYGEVAYYHNDSQHIFIFDNKTPFSLEEINEKLFAVHFSNELIYRSGTKLLTFEPDYLRLREVTYLLHHLKQMEKQNGNLSHS